MNWRLERLRGWSCLTDFWCSTWVHSVGGKCPQEWGKGGGPWCFTWSYSTGFGSGLTSLPLCIAVAFNALHWKLPPPKSYQKSYSDWETKDERRKLWGNKSHQASHFPNISTLFFSKHMLSEAEEAVGSTFTASWSSVYVSPARISVWCVHCNCVNSYTVTAWGFSVPGLPEDFISPIKSSWAPWISCKEGDEMLSGKA